MCCLFSNENLSKSILLPEIQRAELNWDASNRTGKPYSSLFGLLKRQIAKSQLHQ